MVFIPRWQFLFRITEINKTIKYLEMIKKRAEKMVEKEGAICYCQVCVKPVAQWILSPDGEGSYQASIKELQPHIPFFDEGIKFSCSDCYKED